MHPREANRTIVTEPNAVGSTELQWGRLQEDVIDAGLCTHCGTCVGLNPDLLRFRESAFGPLPVRITEGELDPSTYRACPGKGVPYPELYNLLNREGHDLQIGRGDDRRFLHGPVVGSWVGHAADQDVRRRAASGGIISSCLVYLLETGKIDGAVVVRSGTPRPELATPIIATTRNEILASAQSVYYPVPVNEILSQTRGFDGRLAVVGLPDQVASIRMLQRIGHPAVEPVDYILGPYTGTNMYREAIRSFLRGRGVGDDVPIVELNWRAGEWPGYLEVRLEDGRVLRAEKFYYNYLTPFFITRSTLLACDFTNELTDISVGDAWSPVYEGQGKGFSVVLARTDKGRELLEAMDTVGAIELEDMALKEVLQMHGHMLDFKKRGSFLRIEARERRGKPVPHYGYRPVAVSRARRAVELVVSMIFHVASSLWARALSERIPLAVLGPTFNWLRVSWKRLSKPTKRKGLWDQEFTRDHVE